MKGPLQVARETAHVARVFTGAGIVRPIRPDKLGRIGLAFRKYGASPATGYAASAVRRPDKAAICDEEGSVTFEQVHRESNALARSLADMGIGAGDGVAIMARNTRWFIYAVTAISKLGAKGLFMNTMFSGPQLGDVSEREGAKVLIYDRDFEELLSHVSLDDRIVAWTGGEEASDPSIAELVGASPDDDLPKPDDSARFIVLTSGTTGTPKGAQRKEPEGLFPVAAFLDRIPYRAEEATMIGAPLFHSWGFANFAMGLTLGSRYVLRRRFDPEETLRACREHECTALVVVPVMMQRILSLPDEVKRDLRPPTLRITAASGSALPGPLATQWMDTFGDNLYNLYGSTEVAWATIATPKDLRAAPGTAGKPPLGTTLRIVDESCNDVPRGETGRIFVGNDMAFEGYTGGGGKEALGGLLSSGDVGHLDEEGRLFIDGRDDDMIVSGGENVFPREVEDLLAAREEIAEVAVLGVPDEEWGQVLKACIVLRDGAELSEDEIRSHVRSHLASYKVPRKILFMDELPRNATGKILKRELVES